jgi:hypothetical protein
MDKVQKNKFTYYNVPSSEIFRFRLSIMVALMFLHVTN